ncbi:MAG: hypothetical protein KJ923_05320 [Candidatus Omnitrophica bacterium]|nr:hypothetical protein [Candidatus Omnitrophota bacterium]MBU1906398.1 hypothetical protein [Candidatus Omnitrophota bacterium]
MLSRAVIFCRLPQFTAHSRTRLQPIRTASEIPVKIIIQSLQQTPLYQKIAKKVAELHLLAMTHKEIARSLKVSERTVLRAWKFQEGVTNDYRRQK